MNNDRTMDQGRLSTWADALVRAGVPFKERGRDRTGLDCYGVCFLALQEVFGIALPSFTDRYADTADRDGMAALVEEQRGRWTPVEPGAEQPGDVVLMRVEGSPIHVGLVLRPGDLLTSLRGMGVCVERYRDSRWAHRVLGLYRPPAGQPATERHELVPIQALVPVYVRPTPLSDVRRALAVPVGTTLAEIVEQNLSLALQPYAAVAVDGVLVPPRMLARVRPKAGHRVTLTCVPMDSGGSGGGQKNTGALIATIGILIIASVLSYGVLAGVIPAYGGLTLIGIGVGASVATLGVNALLPPPRPKLRELQGATRVSPSIIGTQNELRQFGVVPVVLGRMRAFPPPAAVPVRVTRAA